MFYEFIFLDTMNYGHLEISASSYIREDIPARLLTASLPKDLVGFFVELNLRKKKILMCRLYSPAKNNISSHLSIDGRSLDSYMSSYDYFLVIGDLNSEISEIAMSEFCKTEL